MGSGPGARKGILVWKDTPTRQRIVSIRQSGPCQSVVGLFLNGLPEGFTATLEILNDDLARIVNQSVLQVVGTPPGRGTALNRSPVEDRKSTRLNSSHLVISYAVFCLK